VRQSSTAAGLAERATPLVVRPHLPPLVDPDRWLKTYDGRCFTRKVARDTHISVDDERYYITQALVGNYVTLRVDAAAGELVVEHQQQEVKRLAIKGLGSGPMSFDAYIEQMCAEARAARFHTALGRQLPLPLHKRNH
jgi:hypothetical protein